MRIIMLMLISTMVFSLKIGSYLPPSLNGVVSDVLGAKLGVGIGIESVTEDGIRYDALLSPFYHREYRKSDVVFGFIPLVFVSPNSTIVVFPSDPTLMNALVQSTMERLPFDITKINLPPKTGELFVKLRNMKREGRLVVYFCADPQSAFLYAVERKYSVILPSYFAPSMPKEYEIVGLKEFFGLPYDPPVLWVRLYHNGEEESERVIRTLIGSQEDLTSAGLIAVSEFSFHGIPFRRGQLIKCSPICNGFMYSLIYEIFYTGKDTKKIARELANAWERMIWKDRNTRVEYTATYLTIGFFALLTLLLKMSNHARYVRLGGHFRPVLYPVATYISIGSALGLLTFIDAVYSNWLYFLLSVSMTTLDFISEKRKWWLPSILNFSLLIAGTFHDPILTVADAPFVFTTLHFLNEDFRLTMLMLGGVAYALSKISSHLVYLPFSILMSALVIYILFKRYRESTKGEKSRDYTLGIFRLMYPMLTLLALYVSFVLFVMNYNAVESVIDKSTGMSKAAAMYAANSPRDLVFPVVEFEEDLPPKPNDPEAFERMEVIDRSIVVEKFQGYTLMSFVDYWKVVTRSLGYNSGYLLLIGLILVLNWLVYVFLARYRRIVEAMYKNELSVKSTEIDRIEREWLREKRLSDERLNVAKQLPSVMETSRTVESLFRNVADVLSRIESVRGVWIYELAGDRWREIREGYHITTLPVGENTKSMILETSDGIFALVVDSAWDDETLNTIRVFLEGAIKCVEGKEDLERVLMEITKMKRPKGLEEVVKVTGVLERDLGVDATRVAMVHDVGMVMLDEDLLRFEGTYDEEMRRKMERHVEIGYDILRKTKTLRDLAIPVRHHHEWWNGQGYPSGLKGEEIPLESRVVAVADALVAMVLGRPYKPAKSFEEAIEEIKRLSGIQFDPRVVEILIKRMEEVRRVLRV